jgi:O-antigen/teichoic acid export membrane protein
MMSFQKQIAQSLIWRGLYFITVLVMNIFLSRYFKASGAGWIFYLCNNFSLIVLVAGLTMEASVGYYSAKKSINDSVLAWFSICWPLLISFIVFVVLWFFISNNYITTDISASNYLYYAICYVAGIQLTSFFTGLFYANKDYFLPNFLMVLLNVPVILLFATTHENTQIFAQFLVRLYFSFFLLTGLVLAAAFIIKKQCWQKISLPGVSQLRLLFRYALISLAANVIFFLVYRADYWFVNKYCPAEELGNYIQVSKLGQMLLIVPSIISSVVFPHTAGATTETHEIKDDVLRIGRITTVLFLVFYAFIFFTGKWLFPFVFGPTFQLMYRPFLVLLPGIWALSNLSVLSAYFAGTNKVKVNVTGAALALLVIFIADYVFIPAYGILAAAMISTTGYLLNFMYSFYSLQKEHSISLSQYWRINKDDMIWLKGIIRR